MDEPRAVVVIKPGLALDMEGRVLNLAKEIKRLFIGRLFNLGERLAQEEYSAEAGQRLVDAILSET